MEAVMRIFGWGKDNRPGEVKGSHPFFPFIGYLKPFKGAET